MTQHHSLIPDLSQQPSTCHLVPSTFASINFLSFIDSIGLSPETDLKYTREIMRQDPLSWRSNPYDHRTTTTVSKSYGKQHCQILVRELIRKRRTRSRKSHRKSKNGCNTCRRRHLRCDETLPEWYATYSKEIADKVDPISSRNCVNHGVRCDFLDVTPSGLIRAPESRPLLPAQPRTLAPSSQ